MVAKKIDYILQQRESASIIGIAGVGKSYLVGQVLEAQSRKYNIAYIDFRLLIDFSLRNLYVLILESFVHSAKISSVDEETAAITRASITEIMGIDRSDTVRMQYLFTHGLKQIANVDNSSLVLVFDHFENFYQHATNYVLSYFRALHDLFRGKLQYIVITRRSLTDSAPPSGDAASFIELVNRNQIYVRPVTGLDSLALISGRSNAWIAQIPSLARTQAELLSGGHPNLLATLLRLLRDGENDLSSDSILEHKNVQSLCNRIWASLTTEEQKLLQIIITGLELGRVEMQQLKSLERKGIISHGTRIIFSEIFLKFIKFFVDDETESITYDHDSRRIYVYGAPIPKLTATELRIFEKLYDYRGGVVETDSLAQAGWPDASGVVSSNMINITIGRLRKKIEPDPKKPRFIESLRGQGYRLNID